MNCKPVKPRKCKVCPSLFTPERPLQRACSPMCGLEMARQVNKKRAQAAAAADKRETRAKLNAMKGIPQLIREAQVKFNAFIRARDATLPCISCGAPPPNLAGMHAGRDAGHYRSTGSASHLRFNEDNCHAQCVKCNQWGAGKAVDYRIRLLLKIGMGRVEALESNNTLHKWTREELIELKSAYVARVKEMKKVSA